MLQSLADGLLSESPPPGGRSGLLVNLGTNCLVDAQVLPDLAIGGQMTRTMQLTQPAGCQILMITFRTTGFYRLFGLPMSELANQVLDIETVFPLPFRQRWRLLLEQLKHVSSVQDQIGLIDRQLLAHVNRMPSYKGWVGGTGK